MRIIKRKQQREGIRALAALYALALEGAESLTDDEATLNTVQHEIAEGATVIANALSGDIGAYYLIGELNRMQNLKNKSINSKEEAPIVEA